MIAYKFLRPGGKTIFSSFEWALPEGGRPGAWVDAIVDPCQSGVHACRHRDLPYWVGPELYELELDGEIVEERSKVVASRGRIIRRVDSWTDRARDEYTRMCAERAREIALGAQRPLPEWAEVAAASIPEGPALLGFVAARIAEEIDGIDAYHRERDAQARWLVERLGL